MLMISVRFVERIAANGSFKQPKIVGILNVTADSFSDGGRYLSPDDAVRQATWLAENGADIIEIGAASSHPDAAQVPAKEEIRRIESVLDPIRQLGLAVAVDTFAAPTQRYAVEAGVDLINDVAGFADRSVYPDLAQSGCNLVIMNSLRSEGKATRENSETSIDAAVVADALHGRIQRLVEGGIDRSRLIADPGMGFFLGASPTASFTILRQLSKLRETMSVPIFVSMSRKSFLRSAAGCSVEESASATLTAEVFAALQGVDYIRTHDVKALRHAVRVLGAIFER